MTQKLLGSNVDAAMLATLVQMTRNGEGEMAMYMLHIEIAEGGEDKPEIDITGLLG